MVLLSKLFRTAIYSVGNFCDQWGGGVMDLRRGHFLPKIYAKRKELGPWGGTPMYRARPLDLPMVMLHKFMQMN